MSPQAAQLSSLLVAVASGDRLAYRALYDSCAPKLLGIILRILKDRSRAEDVLQDVFMRVWQNASAYRPDMGNPFAWLASIARNRAIDIIRQKTPDLRGPDEDGHDWFEALADPHDAASSFADRDALRHCLERIEAPVRNCIVLAYCEGYSREELAEKYSRPVNTIKTMLHRGLSALKSCLQE